MTPFERARQAAVGAGAATLARLHKGADEALRAWATTTGRAVYIGNRTRQGRVVHPQSAWGNPYRLGRDGDRATVCEAYVKYLDTRPDLLARVPELAGQVLCCWCAPLLCHGEALLQRLGDGSYERYLLARHTF